jgi:hypothetical protein
MSKITDAARKLPSDPELAIVTFAEVVFKHYHNIAGPLADDDAIFIIRFIPVFVEKFGVQIKINIPHSDERSQVAMEVVNQVLAIKPQLIAKKVDAEVSELLLSYAATQEETFGIARLNAEEKQKILNGIEKIRKIIEESGLPDRKKNALYERLSTLIREVNIQGTRTDQFFAFAGDLAFVLGDMATKAKPLLSEVKEILRIVGRSRARQEGISLPPGDEVLRLPAPDENVPSDE